MIEIVAANEADFEAIQQIAREIWYAHFSNILTPEQIQYMLRMMYTSEVMRKEIEKQIVYKKVLKAQDVVGYLSYGPYVTNKVMKLYKCYLLPLLHGKGYGQIMLQHVCETAHSLGYQEVILGVNKRNEKALKAYQRFGFVVVAAETTDIGEVFVMDDYVLSYKLVY